MNRGHALGPGRLFRRKLKNGRVWILDYTDETGRRRRRSLGSDKRTAERIRSEIIHRRDMARAGLGSEAGQELTLRDLTDDYLQDLRPRVTPRHYHNVQSRLSAVVDELNGTRVGDLRPMDVVRIRNEAVSTGLSHRTANLRVDRLRAMLRWAQANGVIAQDPLAGLKRLPEGTDHQRYRRRALSEDEIARFLDAAAADDERSRLKADRKGLKRVPQIPTWLCLLETGVRYGEMRQTRWGDVDLQRRVLVVRAESAKSRRQRVIPLREEMAERLRELRVHHQDVLRRIPTVHDAVFLSPTGEPWKRPTTNLMRIFDRVIRAAGIPKRDAEGRKLDLHALRHTFGSRLARNGVGLSKVQRLMGHSDPKLTSAVYLHLVEEDLRDAVEALPSVRADAASRKGIAQ